MRQVARGRFVALSDGTRIDVRIGEGYLAIASEIIFWVAFVSVFLGQIAFMSGSNGLLAGLSMVFFVVVIRLFCFYQAYDDPRVLMESLAEALFVESVR